jgi:hypothetical protein
MQFFAIPPDARDAGFSENIPYRIPVILYIRFRLSFKVK